MKKTFCVLVAGHYGELKRYGVPRLLRISPKTLNKVRGLNAEKIKQLFLMTPWPSIIVL